MTDFSEEVRKIISKSAYAHSSNTYLFTDEDIRNAVTALTELVKRIVPEEQVTTHEFCDAYANHGVNLNHCQREIDEDNKKIGSNSCRTEMLRRIG